MEPVVLFAFNGDPMCFIHVLLNALDLADKGMGGRIVVEGTAAKLIPDVAAAGHPLHGLYNKAKERGLIEGVRGSGFPAGLRREVDEIAGERRGWSDFGSRA